MTTRGFGFCFRGFGLPKLSRNVRASALDTTKFVFTPYDAQNATQDRVLKDFGAYFPQYTTIDTRDKIMGLVSSNPTVREWYVAWKGQDAVASSLPLFLDPSSRDQTSEWSKLEQTRLDMNAKQKAWSARIDAQAKALRRVVEEVDKEKKDMYNTLPRLLIINMVTVNQLPLADQVILANTPKADLKKKTNALIVAYQKTLYATMNDPTWVNPFL